MSFDGVLIRSRAMVMPSAMRDRSAASTPSGITSVASLLLALSIAAEAIAAEREGERRQPRIMRCIGESIDAGRQQPGQISGQQRVGAFLVLLQAEQEAGEAPLRGGQREMAAGFGLETCRIGKALRRGREAGANAGPRSRRSQTRREWPPRGPIRQKQGAWAVS